MLSGSCLMRALSRSAPVRPRGTKVSGALLQGKPLPTRVTADERDLDDDLADTVDAAVTQHEDVRMHMSYGLVRPRTPLLERCKIGFVSLPEVVQQRLNAVVRTVPRARLVQEAAGLSDALRARTRFALAHGAALQSGPVQQAESAPVIVYDRVKAMAYAAVRLPGVFGCVSRVLAELAMRRPAFQPTRVLDYGCGPGTALLAIDHVWPGVMRAATAIEPSPGMEWIAQQLLGPELRARVTFNTYQGDEVPSKDAASYDLVVVSYVLSELTTPKVRRRLVRSLWQRLQPGGMLVIIEPGTPVGALCVREARHSLLGVGEHDVNKGGTPVDGRATTVAPCPHDGACPLDLASTWCHFGQRVRRTQLLRSAKSAQNNFEDEKFSYVILERMTLAAERAADVAAAAAAPVEPFARILGPPNKRSGHVVLRGCFADGSANSITVPRSAGAQQYTSARKSGWGDVLRGLGGIRRDPMPRLSLTPRREPSDADADADTTPTPPKTTAKPTTDKPRGEKPKAPPVPAFEDDDAVNAEFARRAFRKRSPE